jgi:hypothetical protein
MSEQKLFTMVDLLGKAGCIIRGRRADCVRCRAEGAVHGHGTIAFTDETFFCHRCKWGGNLRTLSRELRISLPAVRSQDIAARRMNGEFEVWIGTTHLILVRRLRFIERRARLARDVLAKYPECDPAWGALADYHDEAPTLFAALEVVAFDKTPQWLDQPLKRHILFAAFEDAYLRVPVSLRGRNAA